MSPSGVANSSNELSPRCRLWGMLMIKVAFRAVGCPLGVSWPAVATAGLELLLRAPNSGP